MLILIGILPPSVFKAKTPQKPKFSRRFSIKINNIVYITFFSPATTSTQPPDARADILLSYIASQS
jgi:hypothetical protein